MRASISTDEDNQGARWAVSKTYLIETRSSFIFFLFFFGLLFVACPHCCLFFHIHIMSIPAASFIFKQVHHPPLQSASQTSFPTIPPFSLHTVFPSFFCPFPLARRVLAAAGIGAKACL